MKSQKRFASSDFYSLSVQSVDFLSDVAENAVKNITVSIDIDSEMEEAGILEDFAAIVKDSAGDSELSVIVRDPRISAQPIKLSS